MAGGYSGNPCQSKAQLPILCAEGATDLSHLGSGERNSPEAKARSGLSERARASPISPGLEQRDYPGSSSHKINSFSASDGEKVAAGRMRCLRLARGLGVWQKTLPRLGLARRLNPAKLAA